MLKLVANNSKDWGFVYHVSPVDTSARVPVFGKEDFYLYSDFPIEEFVWSYSDEFLEAIKPPEWSIDYIQDGLRKGLQIKQFVLPEGEPRITSKGISIAREFQVFFGSDLFMHAPIDGFMQYAPHQLMFAPTQTGKSFVSRLTGTRFDAATSKALLGFGTADRSVPGVLKGLMSAAVSIDEIPELFGEEQYSSLLTVLADGHFRFAKGISNESYPCNSPIRFMGNPRSAEESAEAMYLLFERMLGKLSKNYAAFGSRFGAVLFGVDYPARSGVNVGTSKEDYINRLQLLRAKVENGKKLVKEIDENRAWLAEKLPDSYLSDLGKFSAKTPSYPVKQFLIGHGASESHMRGMALRVSIVEGITKEEAFDDICEINLKSLGNVADCASEYAVEAHGMRYRINMTEPVAYLFLQLIRSQKERVGVDFFKWEEFPWGKIGGSRGQTREVCLKNVMRVLSKFPEDFVVSEKGVKVRNWGVLMHCYDERFKKSKLLWPEGKEEPAEAKA